MDGELYAERYHLDRLLGKGGVGEVWLARDLELEIDVALKFLKPSFTDEDQEILKHEIRQTRSLSHRHILPVYDFHIPDGEPAAISMEYAPGGSLADFISEETPCLEVNQIATWILQACDALWYAHNQNIIHRDVNPANLMLDAANELKVADFGIASQLAQQLDPDSKKTVGRRGTLYYASPQILHNPYESHYFNDVYALGVTIFVLLSGSFPFRDPRQNRWQWDPDNLISVTEKREQKGRGREPIPATWEYAVARCLAEDPSDRPSSMRELAEMLGSEWVQPTELSGPGQGETKLPPLPQQKVVVEIREPAAPEKPELESSRVLFVLIFAAALGLLGGIVWGGYTILFLK